MIYKIRNKKPNKLTIKNNYKIYNINMMKFLNKIFNKINNQNFINNKISIFNKKYLKIPK